MANRPDKVMALWMDHHFVNQKRREMTDKKLTPRVGDRVLVSWVRRSYIGDVTRIDLNRTYPVQVKLDGNNPDGWYEFDQLTVVDRQPVEWPEGWRKYNAHGVVFHQPSNVALPRDDLAQILATGPDMLARWDELMGGEA